MTKRPLRIIVTLLIFLQSNAIGQTDTAYAFIVAGHAYGAHAGGNLGLHPAFLASLNSGFDPNTAFFVFTGDIVNESKIESWQQVDDEMANYGLPYYYSMGNHDDNSAGWTEFENKFGGTYYTFYSQSELYIVLNSVESGRSISSDQLTFLSEQLDLAGDGITNIFIFFHEILWNSHEKYARVRSNSRSRYDQISSISNYWDEVHPLLLEKPGKNFYLISGDVGGNPDAISAFYDKVDNVTLISSGMGEVADENYLLVEVINTDSIELKLVPLNSDLTLEPIEYYSVPPSPGSISGPAAVAQGTTSVEYSIPEVFNATSYVWGLTSDITGSSSYSSVIVDFSQTFQEGTISVKAERDGFGAGPESELLVEAYFTGTEPTRYKGMGGIWIRESNDQVVIRMDDLNAIPGVVRLLNTGGRIILTERIGNGGSPVEMVLNKSEYKQSILILSITTPYQQISQKITIR